MILDVATALSATAYLFVVAGFIFRLEGKVRHLTDKLDVLESSYRKYSDELFPVIHKLEAKLDLVTSIFLQKEQKEP